MPRPVFATGGLSPGLRFDGAARPRLRGPFGWWDTRDWSGGTPPAYPSPTGVITQVVGSIANTGSAAGYDFNVRVRRQTVAGPLYSQRKNGELVLNGSASAANFWDDFGGTPMVDPVCAVVALGSPRNGFSSLDDVYIQPSSASQSLFVGYWSNGSLLHESLDNPGNPLTYFTEVRSPQLAIDGSAAAFPGGCVAAWMDYRTGEGDVYYDDLSLWRDPTGGGLHPGETRADIFWRVFDNPGTMPSPPDTAAHDAYWSANTTNLFGVFDGDQSVTNSATQPALGQGDPWTNVRGYALFRGVPTVADLRSIRSDFGL